MMSKASNKSKKRETEFHISRFYRQ